MGNAVTFHSPSAGRTAPLTAPLTEASDRKRSSASRQPADQKHHAAPPQDPIPHPGKSLSERVVVCKTKRALRNGSQIDITVKIAQLPVRKFNFGSAPWESIFKQINAATMNRKYEFPDKRDLDYKIHRLNHNGTHAARGARMTMLLLQDLRVLGYQFTKEQCDALTLAAYLLRSGRTDERGHSAVPFDDFAKRSSEIFKEYAQQLRFSAETIEETTRHVADTCKPKTAWIGDRSAGGYHEYASKTLELAHNFDLMRCYSIKKFTEEILPKINAIANQLFDSPPDWLVPSYLQTAHSLCVATGTPVPGYNPSGETIEIDPNLTLFRQMSSDGELCWKEVMKIGEPPSRQLPKSMAFQK